MQKRIYYRSIFQCLLDTIPAATLCRNLPALDPLSIPMESPSISAGLCERHHLDLRFGPSGRFLPLLEQIAMCLLRFRSEIPQATEDEAVSGERQDAVLRGRRP